MDKKVTVGQILSYIRRAFIYLFTVLAAFGVVVLFNGPLPSEYQALIVLYVAILFILLYREYSLRKAALHFGIGIGIALVIFLFVMMWGIIAINTQPKTEQQSTPPDATVQSLLEAVNEERKKVGVAPLALDDRLNKSAQIKADDMTTNHYFAHADSHGKQGYEYIFEQAPGLCSYGSENLSASSSNTSLTALVVDGWKSSKPHYDAMVSTDYSLTGFGISGKYVVEHFCKI